MPKAPLGQGGQGPKPKFRLAKPEEPEKRNSEAYLRQTPRSHSSRSLSGSSGSASAAIARVAYRSSFTLPRSVKFFAFPNQSKRSPRRGVRPQCRGGIRRVGDNMWHSGRSPAQNAVMCPARFSNDGPRGVRPLLSLLLFMSRGGANGRT